MEQMPPPSSSDPDLDAILSRLLTSDFRRRFYLYAKERTYLQHKGLDAVMQHGAEFIAKRLAPALPPRDGKQTPWRGHPVFIAQHATGTCCRGCLERWHSIAKGQALTPEHQRYVLAVIRHWLQRELAHPK